ncbi:MAG: hypothetical protein HY825_00355 [Acidobacteria bacterium]|nr:hypothetical protein [Acidobacteriota bacterium]
MKKVLLVATMLLAAGLMAVPGQVFALGGPHAAYVCNNCHIPHASGGDRLWVEAPTGNASLWGANKIGQLCYSCHDGTPPASNMNVYLYTGSSAHGPLYNAIPAMPDGPAGTAEAGSVRLNASTLPYTSATNPLQQGGIQAIQCTSCHFVHDNTDAVRPYLRSGAASTYRGDLCERCHRRGEVDTAAEQGDSNIAAYVGGNFSLHPIQIAVTVPTQGANMVAGLTPSGAGAPNMGNAVLGDANGDYRLGGKTLAGGATGVMDCTTCHAVHGDEAAGTQGQGNYKLAIDNFPLNYTTSPLCYGCHELPVVTGGVDHPIDANAGKYVVNFPADGGPNHGSAVTAWPAGNDADGDSAVCSSCHDAHGGLPAGASATQGNNMTGRLRRTQGNATNWCYSCHLNASPVNHHSHEGNLNTAAPNSDAMTSILGCDDCHGAAGGTFAHNGTGSFFATRDFGAGNHAASGVWCNYCHSINPTDIMQPVNLAAATTMTAINGGLHTDGSNNITPMGHGVDRGEASHVLGTDGVFTFGAAAVVVTAPKINAWANAFDPEAGSLDGFADNLSRYGMAAATSVATNAFVCESCHNIIGNIGYVAAGSAATETQQDGGWANNLLLENYLDDGTGNRAGAGGATVGSTMCMMCHYGATQGTTGPPGTHQITGQVITAAEDNERGTTTLITGAGSYANAAGSPNTASYPNTDAMDCDSCHRPHDAAPGGTASATTVTYSPASITKGVDFILEEAEAAAGVYSPALCVNCHNY